jgi:protein associated with RNAse G/E
MATIKDLLDSNLSEEFEQCSASEGEESGCDEITCFPNESALVPDWTTTPVEQPFLNQRTCEYEVPIEKISATATVQAICQEDISSINEDLRSYGLSIMLEYYQKDLSENSDEYGDLFDVTYVKAYQVPLERGRTSDDSLSDSFPTKVLVSVPAESLNQIPDKPDEQESSENSSSATIDISAFDLRFKLIRLKNALRVYSKYQAFAGNDPDIGTKVYYSGTKRTVDIDEYKKYVDEFFPALQELVKQQGDYVMRPNRLFKGTKNLTEMSISFDESGIIDGILFYSYGCEDKIKATKGFSKFLIDSYAKNAVISGFINSINDIDDAISAREPMIWYDFVERYFNIDVDITSEDTDISEESSAASCFLQTLEEDTFVFDQILNQIVSIPEIISKKFNDYACMNSDDLAERQRLSLNTFYRGLIAESNASASGQISFDDPIIERLDELIVRAATDDEFGVRDILNEMTVCGLVAFLLSIAECLGGQLSFDQMLRTALTSAIKNMQINHLGKMYGMFPSSIQNQVYNAVIEQLSDEDYSVVSFQWPWDQEPSLTRNTLIGSSAAGSSAVISAFTDATLEYVGAEDLLEYLNTFPGAQIVAKILSSKECIDPPIGINFPEFMKLGDIEFCRANYAITLPRLPELVFTTPLQGIVKALLAAARDALLETFRNLILTLLSKLIYQFKSEICQILDTLGDIAVNTLSNNSTETFANVLNNSVCGDDSESSIGQMFSELGSDQSDDEAAEFINNISSVLTATEICNLLKGTANEDTIRIVFNIVQYKKSNFLSTLPDERTVRSFFASLGNYVSSEELDSICDTPQSNTYVGATVCNDDGIFNDIENLRRKLLDNAGLCAEDIQDELDKINQKTSDNLEQIMDVLQGQGVNGILENSFPSLMSSGDPTCPTSNAVFSKDDPISFLGTNDDIQDALADIDDKFERDIMGRTGFFDYLLCAADGTRLRRQNFINRFPSPLATLRQKFMDFDDEVVENNYFPTSISTPLRDNDLTGLTYLSENIVFDSTIGENAVSFSFVGEGAYSTTIDYRHSNTSDPERDRYRVTVLETYNVNEPTNESNDNNTIKITDE